MKRYWRQMMGVTMAVLGVWLCQLTAPTDFGELMAKTVNHPLFLEHIIPTKEDETSFLPQWLFSRYVFLTGFSVVAEEELLPLPQALVYEEEEIMEGHWEQITMGASEGFLEEDGIFVANNGRVTVTQESLRSYTPPTLPTESAPQILIYHSHGTEAYSPTTSYEESDPFRTLDMSQNITTIGAAMAEVFREAGYTVIHDDTLHDYPDYNSSYQNSAVMLEGYLAEYPSLELIFDVHRDALETEDGTPYQLVSVHEGEEVAQLMLVVGTNGGGYAHPLWEENFSLALSIQNQLLNYGEVARPIALRSSRYNQHYHTGALLLEIGGHGNTFQQAMAGGLLFAQAVVEMLGE